MKFFTLLILFLSSVAVLSSASSPSSARYLWSDDDGANDDDASAFDFLTDAKNYIEEDIVLMWNTSPNRWSEEYWELLGGVVATVFGLLLFIFIVCCAPIFLFGRDAVDTKETLLVGGATTEAGQITEPSITVTDGNAEKDGEKDVTGKTALASATSPVTSPVTSPAASAAASPVSQNEQNRGFFALSMSKSMTDESDAGKSRIPGSNIRGKRKRRSLWSEVGLVWSEFLSDTFGSQNNNERYETPFHTLSSDGSSLMPRKSRAKEYKSPPYRRKSKSPRKSRSTRSSKSPRKSSKSPRKNSSMSNPRSPENKVQKYDGAIV